MNSKRSVTQDQNDSHKRILTQLLRLEGNRICADCRSRNPTWASVNLGVFVCLACSGIHRSLGVHISQVRSTNLDTWLPGQVDFVSRLGNEKANKFWEANVPRTFQRPTGGNGATPELAQFIRQKYVEMRFAAKDMDPPTCHNYTTHPLAVDGAPQPEAPTPQKASVSMDLLDLSSPAPAAGGAAACDPFLQLAVATNGAEAPAAPAPRASTSIIDDWGDFEAAPAAAGPVTSAAVDPFAFLSDNMACATAAPSAPPLVLGYALGSSSAGLLGQDLLQPFQDVLPQATSGSLNGQPPKPAEEYGSFI